MRWFLVRALAVIGMTALVVGSAPGATVSYVLLVALVNVAVLELVVFMWKRRARK